MLSNSEILLNRCRDMYRDMVNLQNDPSLWGAGYPIDLGFLVPRLQAAITELDQVIWRLEEIVTREKVQVVTE